MSKTDKKSKQIQQTALESWLNQLSPAQQQRLRFLEAKLVWEGKINRKAICEQFDLTPNHITREISDYRNYFPQNLSYDVTARAYQATEKFEPYFFKYEPGEYLSLLKLYATDESSTILSELASPIAAEVLAEPMGKLQQHVLQLLIRAVHSHTGLRIAYLSFSQAREIERDIWPHTFIWNGDRWHVRAFDKLRHEYIDIVPQRITKVAALNRQLPTSATEDHDWIESEQLSVIPNPNFSKKQQAMIGQEYGMEEIGKQLTWRVNLRRCLIPYFLFRYRLDQLNDTTQNRIVLKNKDLVRRFAFAYKQSNTSES
ncbi:WYL domain-containing protein [Idiomarina sp. HP20-50]|uniref:WYL domain-containing protein n=1 Tax=Idiomarina sp. HP20-50 TaxID=3070813 RepID=UPI00294AD5D7|nr:WYL domain-containing protein [Idiomarina sp. HP20-50]MDV6316253.1 WYL domain-containing protein [Idiomarina sp. HP20-50]